MQFQKFTKVGDTSNFNKKTNKWSISGDKNVDISSEYNINLQKYGLDGSERKTALQVEIDKVANEVTPKFEFDKSWTKQNGVKTNLNLGGDLDNINYSVGRTGEKSNIQLKGSQDSASIEQKTTFNLNGQNSNQQNSDTFNTFTKVSSNSDQIGGGIGVGLKKGNFATNLSDNLTYQDGSYNNQITNNNQATLYKDRTTNFTLSNTNTLQKDGNSSTGDLNYTKTKNTEIKTVDANGKESVQTMTNFKVQASQNVTDNMGTVSAKTHGEFYSAEIQQKTNDDGKNIGVVKSDVKVTGDLTLDNGASSTIKVETNNNDTNIGDIKSNSNVEWDNNKKELTIGSHLNITSKIGDLKMANSLDYSFIKNDNNEFQQLAQKFGLNTTNNNAKTLFGVNETFQFTNTSGGNREFKLGLSSDFTLNNTTKYPTTLQAGGQYSNIKEYNGDKTNTFEYNASVKQVFPIGKNWSGNVSTEYSSLTGWEFGTGVKNQKGIELAITQNKEATMATVKCPIKIKGLKTKINNKVSYNYNSGNFNVF